jgi:hypothetical protein
LYNGDARWRAAVDLRELIGLPESHALWWWQPVMRYHVIDKGAFDMGDLAARDGLPALLFRLENTAAPEQLVDVADAILAWFGRHPGFQAARTVLVELLSVAVGQLGPGVRVPEAMKEVRNMLQTRVEQWIEQWKQEGRLEGEQRGEQRGEAALLLRLLQRRFGVLPGWATELVRSADSVAMEEWGIRLLDAATLEEVLAGR